MLNAHPCTKHVLVRTLVAISACACPGFEARGQDSPANLVANGGFETDANGDGWADGWRKHPKARIQREAGNAWLALDGSYAASDQSIKLKPEWWKIKLTLRMRLAGVVLGKEGWQNARLAMSFHNEKGDRVGPWPNVVNGVGTSDWVRYERAFMVPRGAAELRLNPANFGSAGKAEFDDIRIVVTRTRSTHREDAALPAGVAAPWDMARAWRRASATRERVCINGLWAFRPVVKGDRDAPPPPGDCWGWFKVPGIWPSDMTTTQAAQNVVLAPWLEESGGLRNAEVAWYKRTIVAPRNWAGRRVLIDFTMVQSHARVFIDGRDAGAIWFPGGLLDVTQHVRPGREQTLAVRLTARPIEMVSQVFMAPDRIIKSRAGMKLKGLTGDVYLVAEPKTDAIGDVHVITSTRRGTITFDTGIHNSNRKTYKLSARVLERGKVVKTFPPQPVTVANGRCSATAPWSDAKLWDTDTPGNLYEAVVTLSDTAGNVLDESVPIRFGFREFWIDGRDFYLNGRRIHLRALHNVSINSPADAACLDGCRNTCRKMLEYGFNFLITANYSFGPGQVGYMDGLFQATDEAGVLASFSLPHVKDFKWRIDKPKQAERYRKLSEWLIRRVQNHPSVVAYAMNHNATGYYGDQNPLKIDGVYDLDALLARQGDGGPRGRLRTRAQAARAAAIAKALDPTRPVYHHQSGNLGDMHTVNIYLNWAPRQERSDWLEHWAAAGAKPVFFVEWGLPHISSWSSYRGPQFIWRCDAFQQIWDSEFAAAYLGEAAYRMTPGKQKALDLEERLWAGGKPFRWSTLCGGIRSEESTHIGIQAAFADDNWRSHRTWGASAMLPWDQGGMWKRVKQTFRREAPGKYDGLQQPGIAPDGILPGSQYIYEADAGAFEPTSLGRSFLRWNRPLLAYVAGGPKRFTEKSHNFLPGETIRKQLAIVNDTRRERTCMFEWSIALAPSLMGKGTVKVQPGDKALLPVAIRLLDDAKPGKYALSTRFSFDNGDTQTDSFRIDVLPRPGQLALQSRVALYDPKGMSAKLLDGLGVRYDKVAASADLRGYNMLVVGREALSNGEPLPGAARVREGLKVLVFEQTADTLANRLGFRINIHGMRTAFARVRSHPALAGLADEHLRDWRGAATLTPPYLDLPAIETANPKWKWCGFTNTHVWRCGNHGNVASVLIEKPARGDWLPIVDCGFDLQYAALLECAEGRGRIVFCQFDVTGRTQAEPAAQRVCQRLLSYLDTAKPAGARKVLYAGDKRGAELLSRLAVPFERLGGRAPGERDLLVVGPGAPRIAGIEKALQAGMNLLCLGLDADDLNRLPPGKVETKPRTAVSALIERLDAPAFAGVSNADLHWRTKLTFAALAQESPQSNEALRAIPTGKGTAVFCQAAPWMFDYAAKPYLRTTYRRNMFLVSRLLANLGARGDAMVSARLAARPALLDYPLDKGWRGKVDRQGAGRAAGWWKPEFDDSAWRPINVPGQFDRQRAELANYNGLFWYRLRFAAPANLGAGDLTLYIGPVDDESWVWLNGRFLGETTKKTRPKDYWAFPRQFAITPDMLRRDNVIAVLVNDTYQTGGLNGSPRLHRPGPWLSSYYVQRPKADDDPYRYYRW